MNNTLYMSDVFERQKNTRASLITAGVAGALILLLILIRWPLPTIPQPLIEDGIEVNLGNSETGSGKDQPLLPGEPAPSKQVAYNPPQPVHAIESNVKDIETDDKNADAPEIKKPAVTSPNATKIDNDNKIVKTTAKPQPVVNEAPPKPKAVLGRTTGGTGNGGNGADRYEKGSNEGNDASGSGDKGVVGGTPGAPNYSGRPGKGNSGVSIAKGLDGRHVMSSQSFEDEFNENAKVAMDVVVDANGKVTSATYQARGSTTSDRTMVDIARRRASQLKFNGGADEQKGTVIFNFRLRS